MYGMRVAEYSSVLIKLAKKCVRITLPYVRYRMGSHSHVGTVWCFFIEKLEQDLTFHVVEE